MRSTSRLGFAEKAAVALLAGMPVLSKPATSSAMVAHRIMELVVEKSCCLKARLLLVGGAGDLVSHLGAQDVCFHRLRRHGSTPALGKEHHRAFCPGQRRSRQLERRGPGPDVEPRSDMYELFLKDVVRDMTQKAGQKCTAIRRVLVPQESFSSVSEDLVEPLARYASAT